MATSEAVVDIRIQIDLAAVGRAAITIGKAGVASAYRASAIAASCCSVRVCANRTTTVAVSRIRLEIDLAAIGRRTITIGKAGSAGSNCTGTTVTVSRGVCKATHRGAGVAVVGVGCQIGFAAIAEKGVAVCKPGIASRNRAAATRTGARRVGGCAGLSAGAAALHARAEISLTTV